MTRMQRRVLVSANDAVVWLWATHRVRVSPVTIRQWAFRNHIGVHRRTKAPYDLREIEAYAQVRGLIARSREFA